MKTKLSTLSATAALAAALVVAPTGCDKPSNSGTDPNVGEPGTITLTTKNIGQMRLYLTGEGDASINWGGGKDRDKLRLSPFKEGSFPENYLHEYIYRGNESVRDIVIEARNVTHFSCANQKLTNLNVNKNPTLTWLDCSGNQIKAFSVGRNTALKELNCGDNYLTVLDVRENGSLMTLSCQENDLTILDVSKNAELTELICWENRLTSLDVSKNVKLTRLLCYDNKLSADALNTLFGTLHDNTVDDAKIIDIRGNPGLAGCDKSIAIAKGWTVKIY